MLYHECISLGNRSFQNIPNPPSPGVNKDLDVLPLGAQSLLNPEWGSIVNFIRQL